MTRAFRCDRCHGFEVGDCVLRITTATIANSETPATQKTHDLCTPCCAALQDFLAPPSQDAPMNDYAGGV